MKINNIHIVFFIKILSDKHIKFILCFYYCMITLRRPKGKSEAVIRRTDNTMTKGKNTKRETTIHKTLRTQLRIEPCK